MTKQKVCLSVGISGSGKTTWSNKFVQEHKEFHNLNRDDIRTSLCGSREIWSQGREFEELVTKIQEAAGREILKAGKSLIVSDTNLSLKTQRRWQEIAAEFDADFEINDSFLAVPLDVCLERDAKRDHAVGAVVIKRQFEMARKLKPLEPLRKIEKIVQDSNKTGFRCAVFDLDGSAALFEKDDKTQPHYRNPYDASTCENDLPNIPVLLIAKWAYQEGYDIFFVSGREDKYRPQTERWLSKHGVKYHNLFMRKSGDYRNDADIKEEIYRNQICPDYTVEMVIDDRLRVCKRLYQLGLPVFRVGDPEADF